jgi:glycogen operon protein
LAGVEPQEPALHVMINMSVSGRTLPLPDPVARNWRRIVDTTYVAPDDVIPAGLAVTGNHYVLGPHGIAVFEDSRDVVELRP